jgi:predicted transcriptional regulator
MTEGIGKALASAIKEERVEPRGGPGGDLFSNRFRREIFSRLTLAPCAGVGPLVSGLGISRSSVCWHLQALVRAGYVVEAGSGRAASHYPEGLIDGEEAALFAVINRPGNAETLRLVLGRPGLAQSEIASELGTTRQMASRALATLGKAGVVKAVSEGPHVRHYPTSLIPERAEAAYRRSRLFSDFIIRKIAGQGGAPPVVVRGGLDRILLEAGQPHSRFTIEVGINPYVTCTAC